MSRRFSRLGRRVSDFIELPEAKPLRPYARCVKCGRGRATCVYWDPDGCVGCSLPQDLRSELAYSEELAGREDAIFEANGGRYPWERGGK